MGLIYTTIRAFATVLLLISTPLCYRAFGQNGAKATALPQGTPSKIPGSGPLVKDPARTDTLLLQVMKRYPAYFDSLLALRKERNIQVIYTQIDRGANGMPALKHFYFNVDSAAYFYPAGAVGLPLAQLTMQAVTEMKPLGIELGTTMITEKGYGAQTAVYNDPAAPKGKPTIAQYLKKMLIIGDADAFNRLYELLGPLYINDQLRRKGYGNTQIVNRLDPELSEDEHRHTNPIRFFGADNRLVYEQPGQYYTGKYLGRRDSVGRAWYQNGKLIKAGRSAAHLHYMPLETLHNMMVGFIFPAKVSAGQRFNLSETDRQFLLKYMSQLPKESVQPPYSADSSSYPAGYNKFILAGGGLASLPDSVRIFNVTGSEYGYLTDVAYVVDFKNGVEFFVSAVINCNRNGILQEAHYDYDAVGMPFLQHLGEVLYQYELKRSRKVVPDLSALKFVYDGR